MQHIDSVNHSRKLLSNSVRIGSIIIFSILLASNFSSIRIWHARNCLIEKNYAIDNTLWHRAFKDPKVENRGKTAVVCTIAKHEVPYIMEWLDYNIALGFAHIYLFDNSDLFELNDLNEKYRKYGIVDVVHAPGMRRQCPSYYDCASRAIADNHTWAFFTDVDEFLVLKQHDNVADFANEYVSTGSVGINWRVFGTSGKEIYEPIPVLKRFQYRYALDRKENFRIKSIVRLEHMKLKSECKDPHFFPLKHGYFQKVTDGTVFTGSYYTNKSGPDNIAAVYHYHYKSYHEFIMKRMRGSAFYGDKISQNQTVTDAINRLDKKKRPISAGSIYDDTAWVKLKKMIPRYELYDSLYPLN